MVKYPSHLLTLIAHLKKLPGVGKRTAERFAFQLLKWEESDLDAFSNAIQTIQHHIDYCETCGCMMEKAFCLFCNSTKRDPSLLCIVAHAKDVFSFEETGQFQGLYHVLGTLLSPLDGKVPEDLNLPKLVKHIQTCGIKEVVIALDSTLEGDATALFLKDQLKSLEIKVSRLAFGLPLGSSLDFIDEGTLCQALAGRQAF